MKETKRIMFVCHGNICRSPMAELIAEKLAASRKMADRLVFASAATSDEEIVNGIGNPIYPPAARELRRCGIEPGGHRAVQLTRRDYDNYDLFICMDSNNIRNAMRIFGGDPEGKLCRLMSFAGKNRDVADPWFTGDFETARRDIFEGCEALLNSL